MSREHNEQIMRTYLEDIAANERIDLIAEIAHEDMVDEFSDEPGRDALVAHVKGFHESLVDRTITIRKIIATEDEVMAWWTAEGLPVDEMFGVEPNGGRVWAHAFSFFTITDGRISRYRGFVVADFGPPITYFDTTTAEHIPLPVGATASERTQPMRA
jgi:predicted ester cyclase